MATIVPPPAASHASANLSVLLTQPPSAVPVTVNNAAQALENLARVIQISATVTSQPTANSVTLTTSLGALTVAFAQSLSAAEKQNLTQQLITLLQTQKPLTLVLQPGSPPTQAVLLLPPSPATATNATQAAPAQNIQALPLQTGDVLPAIVLPAAQLPENPAVPLAQTTFSVAAQNPAAQPAQAQPAPSVQTPAALFAAGSPAETEATSAPQIANAVMQTESALLPQQKTLPEESGIAATIIEPQTEQAPSAPVFSQMPATNLANTANYAPATPAPVASNTLASLLQPGNEISLHIDAILPPSTGNIQTPPLAANQIAATVVGTGTNGQLILKAGDATLFVKAPVTAPVGTNVIVSVTQAKEAPLMPLPPLEVPNFQSLPQAIAALAQINPQILQQVLNNYIPQPTQNLPGALLFLLSAFKGGNLRDWLGNAATDSLTMAGKIEILASLSKVLNDAGQIAHDPTVGQWRSYPIPLYAQQQFQALTLHVHGDRDARQGPSGNPEGNKIRFLIDMRLSKLGEMQIDGFVQPKKLDMILRSENILPEGLHSELRSAYVKALGAVGYAGTLHFQVGRQHWMTMSKPATQGIVT